MRAFYNVCPHRGNVLLHDPAGNARAITCIFHAWTFDGEGHCTGIARRKEGYQDRLSGADLGLRRVRTAVGYGGFVWVNVDDGAPSLGDWIGPALETLEPFLRQPLEVFHYQKVVVQTNYKLWHDTNSEFYHDYMHYFNRVTGMQQPGYFQRRYTPYPNGHAAVGIDGGPLRSVRRQRRARRRLAWADAGGWILVDLFPGITYNLRTSVIRLDTAIPLSPNQVMIEFRGLGLKDDTPETRAARVRDHNQIWGPFGRNLHEDLLGVQGQGIAMRDGRTDSRWVLHAREEDQHHPRRDRDAALLRDVEPLHGPFALRSVRRGGQSMSDARTAVAEVIASASLRLDDDDFEGFLALCTPDFHYTHRGLQPRDSARHDLAGSRPRGAGSAVPDAAPPQQRPRAADPACHRLHGRRRRGAGRGRGPCRRCRCSGPPSTAARRRCSRSARSTTR